MRANPRPRALLTTKSVEHMYGVSSSAPLTVTDPLASLILYALGGFDLVGTVVGMIMDAGGGV